MALELGGPCHLKKRTQHNFLADEKRNDFKKTKPFRYEISAKLNQSGENR
jgi:hypothetical protein